MSTACVSVSIEDLLSLEGLGCRAGLGLRRMVLLVTEVRLQGSESVDTASLQQKGFDILLDDFFNLFRSPSLPFSLSLSLSLSPSLSRPLSLSLSHSLIHSLPGSFLLITSWGSGIQGHAGFCSSIVKWALPIIPSPLVLLTPVMGRVTSLASIDRSNH